VTSESSLRVSPYPVVVPYSTTLVALSLVVHVIVAELEVIPEASTLVMTGGVVSKYSVVELLLAWSTLPALSLSHT
jgi:hypothetical protein